MRELIGPTVSEPNHDIIALSKPIYLAPEFNLVEAFMFVHETDMSQF